jgi:hypothetical protein
LLGFIPGLCSVHFFFSLLVVWKVSFFKSKIGSWLFIWKDSIRLLVVYSKRFFEKMIICFYSVPFSEPSPKGCNTDKTHSWVQEWGFGLYRNISRVGVLDVLSYSDIPYLRCLLPHTFDNSYFVNSVFWTMTGMYDSWFNRTWFRLIT